MWALLENRPETRALYAEDATETADKIPFSLRQALGNFPFEIDYTSYNNPQGNKELVGVIGKVIGKNPELKLLWNKWLKLPFVGPDGATKKHTNPSLFKMFQFLADIEAEILVQVQNDILAKEEADVTSAPIPVTDFVPEVKVEEDQDVLIVDEPTTMRVTRPKEEVKTSAPEPNPVSGMKIAESPASILRRINAGILKQKTDNSKSLRLPEERVTFKDTTFSSSANKQPYDPLGGIQAILRGYQKCE